MGGRDGGTGAVPSGEPPKGHPRGDAPTPGIARTGHPQGDAPTRGITRAGHPQGMPLHRACPSRAPTRDAPTPDIARAGHTAPMRVVRLAHGLPGPSGCEPVVRRHGRRRLPCRLPPCVHGEHRGMGVPGACIRRRRVPVRQVRPQGLGAVAGLIDLGAGDLCQRRPARTGGAPGHRAFSPRWHRRGRGRRDGLCGVHPERLPRPPGGGRGGPPPRGAGGPGGGGGGGYVAMDYAVSTRSGSRASWWRAAEARSSGTRSSRRSGAGTGGYRSSSRCRCGSGR